MAQTVRLVDVLSAYNPLNSAFATMLTQLSFTIAKLNRRTPLLLISRGTSCKLFKKIANRSQLSAWLAPSHNLFFTRIFLPTKGTLLSTPNVNLNNFIDFE